MRAPGLRGERGIALVTVLLISVVLSAIVLGTVMMTFSASLVGKDNERMAVLDDAATAGLEEARSRLNGNRSLYPASGYVTLESNAQVRDANNQIVPGVRRWVYAGPTGITSGQFGVVGAIIAVAADQFGNKVVRRLDVNQESFAKFSYFTDSELDTLGNTIVFGGGDQLRGPVFSNDQFRIHTSPSPAAYFYDQVMSARSTIINQGNGWFARTPQLGVDSIPMPDVADLNRLDSLAQLGGTRFTGSTAGDGGEARTRIEFLVIDVGPSDGGPQGFFRVYQGTNEDFVSASLPTGSGYLTNSYNCGDFTDGNFLAARRHTAGGPNSTHNHSSNANTNRQRALTPASGSSGRIVRCFLGGDSILTDPGTNNAWLTSGHWDNGTWVQAPAPVRAALAGVPALAGRNDVNFLFPLDRKWNPLFKNVIYVAGKVIVSGVVHGRVTVAASGNIIFGDDLSYFENPGTRDCATGDMIGFFSGGSIVVANNTINAPQTVNTNMSISGSTSGTSGIYSYDETKDETVHGFFLTLTSFGAEDHNVGAEEAEPCTTGGTFPTGRGCLNTYGGIIQGNRGTVGMTSGTGYIKRYQYDACGATNPPPYFPTTGVFERNRFHQMDPTRFNVAAWFAANQH